MPPGWSLLETLSGISWGRRRLRAPGQARRRPTRSSWPTEAPVCPPARAETTLAGSGLPSIRPTLSCLPAVQPHPIASRAANGGAPGAPGGEWTVPQPNMPHSGTLMTRAGVADMQIAHYGPAAELSRRGGLRYGAGISRVTSAVGMRRSTRGREIRQAWQRDPASVAGILTAPAILQGDPGPANPNRARPRQTLDGRQISDIAPLALRADR